MSIKTVEEQERLQKLRGFIARAKAEITQIERTAAIRGFGGQINPAIWTDKPGGLLYMGGRVLLSKKSGEPFALLNFQDAQSRKAIKFVMEKLSGDGSHEYQAQLTAQFCCALGLFPDDFSALEAVKEADGVPAPALVGALEPVIGKWNSGLIIDEERGQSKFHTWEVMPVPAPQSAQIGFAPQRQIQPGERQ